MGTYICFISTAKAIAKVKQTGKQANKPEDPLSDETFNTKLRKLLKCLNWQIENARKNFWQLQLDGTLRKLFATATATAALWVGSVSTH